MQSTMTEIPASVANPLTESGPMSKACWQLGYHDGVHNLAESPEAALSALAAERLKTCLSATSSTIADLKGQLRAAEEASQSSTRQAEESVPLLLPHFGRHSVGAVQWLVVCLYALLAVLAVAAEFPVSLLTIGESTLGNLDAAQMDWVRTYSAWALGAMMCLLGFSLKLLTDSFERLAWRRWFEPPIALAAVALSMISLSGIARLREAIGNQATAFLVKAATDVQVRAAQAVAEWSDFTFMWITLTLPCFSVACIVLAVRQGRDYRLHRRALKDLQSAETTRVESMKRIDELTSRIANEEQAMADLRSLDVKDPVAKERYRAVYQHGLATGHQQRRFELGKRGVYEKLRHLVAVSA